MWSTKAKHSWKAKRLTRSTVQKSKTKYCSFTNDGKNWKYSPRDYTSGKWAKRGIFCTTVEPSLRTPVNTHSSFRTVLYPYVMKMSWKFICLIVYSKYSIVLTTTFQKKLSTEFLMQQKHREAGDKTLVFVIHRCRGAVASPREQQIDIYITWIMQMRREIAARGQSTNPVAIKDEIKQHEVSVLVRFVILFLTR